MGTVSRLADRLSVWREPTGLTATHLASALPDAAVEVKRLLAATPVAMPPRETLEGIYRQLREANRSDSLLALPARVLRLAPWVMFESWEGEAPLAKDARFLAGYELTLRQRRQERAAMNLAQALLGYFDPKSDSQERLRATAREVLRESARSRYTAFLSRADSFGLLRGDGPTRFAERFFEGDETADVLLGEAGLTGPLEYFGFVEYAFLELARLIEEKLGRHKLSYLEVERLLTLAEVNESSGRRLRFALNVTHRLAESMLLPFESQEPAGVIQAVIKRFILEHLGDPRLKHERWNGVDARAERVMRRWLVAATLEDFFSVLDESMKRDLDADADRHWPYRRAFWTAYLQRDQISEAWVVLGPRVAEDTRHVLSELSAHYGSLKRAGGARPSHAVLILQIGTLVITEWSHSGKYRVWRADNPRAPKFYRRQYHRDDLVTLPDFEGTHHGAEKGRWQAKLEEYIGKQTGIRISLRDLMPRT